MRGINLLRFTFYSGLPPSARPLASTISKQLNLASLEQTSQVGPEEPNLMGCSNIDLMSRGESREEVMEGVLLLQPDQHQLGGEGLQAKIHCHFANDSASHLFRVCNMGRVGTTFSFCPRGATGWTRLIVPVDHERRRVTSQLADLTHILDPAPTQLSSQGLGYILHT